ncbi:hypothetical protein GQ43DRAFT_422963 [Delitschia confertaspora ATCC 74209]|uniref:gamma-glutamylcyclotransferase n=1 Tax=Delitschia confertaspora ATCC 74209 TaxID=1513339 RepID=A0A9P4JFC2_9PLEO|nr:hypothetical protein GQ43DRAFT_422963 [Delitschia confertaspora ATCC 74209]
MSPKVQARNMSSISRKDSSSSLEPLHSTTIETTESSVCKFNKTISRLRYSRKIDTRRNALLSFPPLPETSEARLSSSVTDTPFDLDTLASSDVLAAEEKHKTILYLAYGSNLCRETFRGKRGIRPLSQINVQVPELRLTFDLPGIPYSEPCFANTARRDESERNTYTQNSGKCEDREMEDKYDYHKDRWHKGLVGCVYEVTPADYAHIIATEGGGASYQDILVTCYPLSSDLDTVPEEPTTRPFKAHTLFAPAAEPNEDRAVRTRLSTRGALARPDPSYAQPSVRYLKLLTDGAAELSLPTEYQDFLLQIHPYTITSPKQKVGALLFLSIWGPLIAFLFALQERFQDDRGRSPLWLANMMGLVFLAVWGSYDWAFKGAFGDGERTIEDGGDEGEGMLQWLGRRRGKGGGYLV